MDDTTKPAWRGADMEAARANAKTKRQLAWDALKQGQDPRYVAMRYGYDVEQMQAAAEKLGNPKPPNSGTGRHRANPAANVYRPERRASELLPEVAQRSREPGEDDECAHGDDPTRCQKCKSR